MTKSTKSHLRGFSILLKITFRVHEFVARAMRGECVRHGINQKSVVLRSPKSRLYHACEHITRDSRADSCTHCLHARYKCKAGVNLVCTLTGWSVYTLVWCKLLFLRMKKSRQEIRGFPALAYIAHKISKSTEKHIYKTKAFRGERFCFYINNS